MKTNMQIHYDNYLAYSRMLEGKTHRPGLKKLLEDELERNRELFLHYSQNDHAPLQMLGFTPVTSNDGKIEYRYERQNH